MHDLVLDMKTIKSWGGNTVRIIVDPCDWRDRQAAVSGLLHDAIQEALREGLYPVIDWHEIGWPDGWSHDGGVRYDTSFTLTREFWSAMSSQYQDGRVLFELWNEPAFQSSDSGSMLESRWHDLKPYYENLVSLVRSNGSSAVCIVAGSHYASDLRGAATDLLDDPDVAYVIHLYPGSSMLENIQKLAGLERSVPVLVTEWGFDRMAEPYHFLGSPESYGNALRDYVLDGKGLSYFAWGYHEYEWMGIFQVGGGGVLTEWGRFVKSCLGRTSPPSYTPIAITNSLGRTAKSYLFQVYGDDPGAEHCHLVDGQTTGEFVGTDGLYLVNQLVGESNWANGGGYALYVNGIQVRKNVNNSHGHQMLAFRIDGGRILAEW